jgi:hypothetical protein
MVQTLPIASPNDLLRTPPRTHHKNNYPAGTMKIGERLDTVAVTPFINFMMIFAAHRDLNVPTLHPHVFSHSSANIILQKSHYVPCLRHLRRVPPRSSASSCSKIGPTTVFFPADARRNWPKRWFLRDRVGLPIFDVPWKTWTRFGSSFRSLVVRALRMLRGALNLILRIS